MVKDNSSKTGQLAIKKFLESVDEILNIEYNSDEKEEVIALTCLIRGELKKIIDMIDAESSPIEYDELIEELPLLSIMELLEQIILCKVDLLEQTKGSEAN